MTDDHLTYVQKPFRAVEQLDLQGVLAAYHPEIVIHEAESASLPYGGKYVGHKRATQHAAGYVAAWDKLQSPAERGLEATFHQAAENPVFVVWRQKAVASAGSRINMPVVSGYVLEGGKIVEGRMHHFNAKAVRDSLDRAGATQ